MSCVMCHNVKLSGNRLGGDGKQARSKSRHDTACIYSYIFCETQLDNSKCGQILVLIFTFQQVKTIPLHRHSFGGLTSHVLVNHSSKHRACISHVFRSITDCRYRTLGSLFDRWQYGGVISGLLHQQALRCAWRAELDVCADYRMLPCPPVEVGCVVHNCWVNLPVATQARVFVAR